jgi:hypothetical protein
MAVDQLRIYRDVTRELGIRLGVHYSGLWDNRALELHPDWARIDEKGQPDKRIICTLSPYAETLMIPQLIELIDKYDVDGFWVDGETWAALPCWCPRCKAQFARGTGIAEPPVVLGQANWQRWLAFHREQLVRHVTRYADAVHARKAGCLVACDWLYTAFMPDDDVAVPVDYLSGDWDRVFGTDRILIDARCLASRGLSWDFMTWLITKAGQLSDKTLWMPKTTAQLCQELAEVVALGGSAMIYEQPQRTGWLTGWRNERIAEAAEFCRARQAICWRSEPLPQAAVLHLASHYYTCNTPLYQYGAASQPVEGALHALLETHHSTDVLAEGPALRQMASYELVVVPEHAALSERMLAGLEAFA